ncbi:hypothetical protein ElyMa_004025400 [Elysia marginata]|uniref:Uncharacterized protein n=1 Tax=Elysia marginata TaxID=1093978 RepID=A0AAV4G1N8_9GAST|nr:hypothetical protein ElyMa_004025400 [Elysia marginata]
MNITVKYTIKGYLYLDEQKTKTPGKVCGTHNEKKGVREPYTTGRMEGKKSRGRQREKILDGMTSWMGTQRVTDALSETWDRESWKDMIANAKRQGT